MRIVNPGEVDAIPQDALPQHVAVIIDGNRRWAYGRGVSRAQGHEAAAPALARCIREAHRVGIQHLTIYGMSTENMHRSKEELLELAALDRWLWPHEVVAALRQTSSHVALIGGLESPAFRPSVFEPLLALNEGVSNFELRVTFAINYGGRAELTRAAALSTDSAGDFEANLYLSRPDVDLLIRTSGEQRLSNFLLWQVAYSEFVFMDTLWPDFSALHLDSAIVDFVSRRRRMGQ